MNLWVEVLHITEYADILIKDRLLSPRNEVPMRVTYHDPCHLGRRGEAYTGDWSGEDKLDRPIRFK
ncbi:MAG: hypothetical protein SWK76_07275 [Actinomycetota bacterium]|nr:hypothetical protein [Actinomycetota bacterium]